ncbi:glycosyltransferase family 4 protein [Halobellus captivus]|uniref:glycosyltransferase family 4 protein n=1 Tax=Halobellus captivus TaxID=2592614 RepID=UPI0011A588F7|nr:glycosyltransferase family 4 protein [Halobellus captivus]
MTDSTHVAILVKEFPPDIIGGTETQTMRMAQELQRQDGVDVTVYTKQYDGPEPHDPTYDLVRVPNIRHNDFVSTLTFLLVALVYLLRDARRIDVLQCMMVYPCGYLGYLVNRIRNIPYFAWIRGGDYYFMKENPVKRRLIKTVLDGTLVLVQTEQVRKDVLREFPDANLEVLGNGVDIPVETEDGDAVVFVGRLKEQKGVHVLIRAMAEVDRRLLVVGDGPEREKLEALADGLGVDARFVGEVPPDEVTKYLVQGAIFVLPSVRGEGLPNALLEAMAAGLPVVATDTGGVADTIREGDTGFLVSPGDEVALRDRLETLLRDDTRRGRMGVAAREYVIEHRAWDALTDTLVHIYEQIRSQ